MVRYDDYRRDDLLAHYHKRSNVESVFSAIKQKWLGRSSWTATARVLVPGEDDGAGVAASRSRSRADRFIGRPSPAVLFHPPSQAPAGPGFFLDGRKSRGVGSARGS